MVGTILKLWDDPWYHRGILDVPSKINSEKNMNLASTKCGKIIFKVNEISLAFYTVESASEVRILLLQKI